MFGSETPVKLSLIEIEPDARTLLSELADGDARRCLNLLYGPDPGLNVANLCRQSVRRDLRFFAGSKQAV